MTRSESEALLRQALKDAEVEYDLCRRRLELATEGSASESGDWLDPLLLALAAYRQAGRQYWEALMAVKVFLSSEESARAAAP